MLVSDRLIEATYAQRLSSVAAAVAADPETDAAERDLAGRALDACATIEAALASTEREVLDRARSFAPSARVVEAPGDRQRHAVTVRVPDVDAAEAIAELLGVDGFERWDRWTRGARRSFRRSARQLTVARTADETTVCRLDWGERRQGAGWRRIVRRLTTPTAGDWNAVDLPEWAWWGYVAIRPIRQLAERTGLRRRHEASLGPFLATPDSLLPALFELAELGPDDRFVDLGCGDGRIAVAAADQRGCVALGVEHDAALVERARQRAADAGVAERVEIRLGDARDVDLGAATCVFVFLPADVTADLLPDVLAALPPGARVIAHEQSRPVPTAAPRPSRTELVVGADAVTVARRWDVRSR